MFSAPFIPFFLKIGHTPTALKDYQTVLGAVGRHRLFNKNKQYYTRNG